MRSISFCQISFFREIGEDETVMAKRLLRDAEVRTKTGGRLVKRHLVLMRP